MSSHFHGGSTLLLGTKDRDITLWIVGLALVCAALTVHPEFETDPFWHRFLGRAVIEHGSRTVPEPVALAAFARPVVVPEWLWGVVTYGLFRASSRFGPAAFTAALAAAIAVAVVKLVQQASSRPGVGAAIWISGATMAILFVRIRLRPEAAALVILPAFLIVAYRYREASGRQRSMLGAALVALEVLWAQLHGSFVLAPVCFFVLAGASLIGENGRAVTRTDLLVALALVLGLASGAHGIGVVDYIAMHAAGDAPRHVVDMKAPSWSDFSPSSWLDGPYGGPYAPCLVALWLVGVAGMLRARRVFIAEALLAALGLALLLTARRFIAIGAVLACPLAARSASEVTAWLPPAPRARRWAAVLAGAAALFLQGRALHAARGPLGKLGLAEGAYPIGAAAYLRRLPAGTGALTTFDAGAPLGFWLEGRIRTFVDSRTPLHFDEAEFGVSRDVFRSADALARAARRYGASAIVLERRLRVCSGLTPQWAAVVIEPRFTTWVASADVPGFVALAACGSDFLGPDACRDGGSILDEEILRLSELVPSKFVRYLQAERVVRCGGSLDGIEALIPSRSDASWYIDARDALEAEVLLLRGRPSEAVDVLEDALRRGDLRALQVVGAAMLRGQIPGDRVHELLDAAATSLDDAAPPELRAILADLCARRNDVRCVRFHALRAAAGGSRSALPALDWLAQHHPEAWGRADAAAWREVLLQTPEHSDAPVAPPPQPPSDDGDAEQQPP